MFIFKGVKREQMPVVAVSLITALCLLGDSMLYIALPIYYQEVGLNSLWEVGVLLSVNRFVRVPVGPFIGWIYRKTPLRYGLTIAVFLAIISTVGYGCFTGFVSWIILRSLWGISWSFLKLGGLFTVIEQSDETNRGKQLGLYNGLYRLGSLFGMLFGGFFITKFGFQFTSISFGTIMILGFVLIYKLIPVTHVEEKSLPVRKIHSLNLLFTKKIILVIMTGMLLAFFIQGMFTSTLSLIMKQHYSEQVQFVGITVGVAALAGMVQSARWLWEPMIALKFGSISDGRFGRIRLLLLFLLISSISLAFIPLKMSIYSWLVIIFVFMMSATVLTTVTDAIATDIGLEYDSNLVMTYYTLFIDIGAALGPFIVYLIIDFQHGVTSSYLFGSVMFLSLTVQWYWMDKINKRITMPVEVSLK